MFRVGRVDRITRFLACACLAVFAACSDRTPTSPVIRDDRAADLLGFLSKPKLLECESDETVFATVPIEAAVGGTVSVGGASVFFPAGALLEDTEVTLTVPASPYVEIDIKTNNGQYLFPAGLPQPIVTISYARCKRLDVLFKPLSAWYIDSETKELLERQLSVDNKLTRTVTFPAGHFSGYAIAF